MTATAFVILGAAALVASIISAILGMGGGIMLLAIMLSFMPHGDAIPTHAVVQMASNGTRVLAFMKDVDFGVFARFCAGVVPGGMVGMLLLWSLGEPGESEPYLKILVGTFILVATFLPKPKRDHKSAGKWWDFPAMGFAAGTAGLTIGAVGPLIAPLFARRDFVKERLIATKAMCQLATHMTKIPAFLLVRKLDIDRLGAIALLMVCMVIPGTLIGKRLLRGISERHFMIAFRIMLVGAGLKVLCVDGFYRLLAP